MNPRKPLPPISPRNAACFTLGRALVGFFFFLLGGCMVSDEERDGADRARSLPLGASVSEGRVSARTFESGLIQERGKHGYLVLRESYVAPEFMTVYAAGLGLPEEVPATWEEDRKKALTAEQRTVRIHGKPVTVHVARFRQFGDRGRKVHYAWIRVNGQGVKVERNEYQPAHLFKRETPDSERREIKEFRNFAESIRVGGS